MNKNISMVITFVAGIVVGVSATYKIAETKYQNIANEEIESVISSFTHRQPLEQIDEPAKEDITELEHQNKSQNKPKSSKTIMTDYKRTIDKVGYDTISTDKIKPNKKNNRKKEEELEKMDKQDTPEIFVISPDEFNTLDGYDTATMYYSSDNYVLDSNYTILSDKEIECMIGHDPAGHFGEYEEDSVFIRNEVRMCDYEILLSMKTAASIMEG